MTAAGWKDIRTGAKRVSVYNEALLVFLYDESNLDELKNSEADFESGYAESDAEIDKPLKRLAKNGTLIAYELFQDAEICVDVIVGPPLTKSEIKNAFLRNAQCANLRLPSGVLRIDSANTLPMNQSQGDVTEEQPGQVNVPPGDYLLSLYRVNLDQYEADSIGQTGDGWEGPNEVIVLTPISDAKPVKTAKPLLRFVRSSVPWIGRYKIDDNVFHGKAYTKDPSLLFIVNIDRAAAQKLGLTKGSILRLVINDFTMEAIFVGEVEMPGKFVVNFDLGTRSIMFRMTTTFDDERDHKLVVERLGGTVPFPALEEWVPVSVTVLEDVLSI